MLKLSIDEAKANILAFQDYILPLDHTVPQEELAIGQKLDLHILKDFLNAIERHPRRNEVDAVRIYFAKSMRVGDTQRRFDIVMIPVFNTDVDFMSCMT